MSTIIPDSWEIPVSLRQRFGDNAGRQRAMLANGHLLIVVHEPPQPRARDRKPYVLWRAPDGAWRWTKNGNQSGILKSHLAQFMTSIDELEHQLQTASCADDYFQLLQAVMPLHRTSRHLHCTMQQAREMIPMDHDLIAARDLAADIERAFELIHMDAKNGLDYTVAQRSEQQSQSSYQMAASAHRLNMLAAIFFPITAISAVFGMNIPSGIEKYSSTGLFWALLAIGFISGLILSKVIAHKPITDQPIPATDTTNRQTPTKKKLSTKGLKGVRA